MIRYTYFLDLKYIEEIIRVRMDKIEYIIPEKKIMKVRSIQMSIPHATGLTFTNKIPIIINGIAIIANFFHTLNTLSEKIRVINNEAEMKRGIATKTDTSSLKKNVLHV